MIVIKLGISVIIIAIIYNIFIHAIQKIIDNRKSNTQIKNHNNKQIIIKFNNQTSRHSTSIKNDMNKDEINIKQNAKRKNIFKWDDEDHFIKTSNDPD